MSRPRSGTTINGDLKTIDGCGSNGGIRRNRIFLVRTDRDGGSAEAKLFTLCADPFEIFNVEVEGESSYCLKMVG